MADTTKISDLTEKQTLVDTDKILVEDANGVGQALLGSAISDKINGALVNKAEYQNQNSNEKYVNSNNNKYLVIKRNKDNKIYYFNCESYILIDDAGNKIYFLTFIKNDNGINAILTNIAGDQLLSVYKVSEEYCVLTTNANWPKKYTVYSLNGYKPQVYATSVSPL